MADLTRRHVLKNAGLAALAGMGATVVACAPTTGQAPAPAASGPRKPTGTLTITVHGEPLNLDAHRTLGTNDHDVVSHIYDTLLWRDGKTSEIGPWLAESFRNVDPLTWEFKLRANAKFHDGTPVNSDAVKFSFDRRYQAKIGEEVRPAQTQAVINYDRTEIVDERTFRIKTKVPTPTMLGSLVTPYHNIVPPSVFKDESQANLTKVAAAPVGSGPWKFVEWKRGERITLAANPDFWGPPPAFETLNLTWVGEQATGVLKLQRGEIQAYVNVPPEQRPGIEATSGLRTTTVTGTGFMWLQIRQDKHPALADKRVRQAMNYALNYDAINKGLLLGIGERMKSVVNPPNEPPSAKPYTYDVAKAKALLKEAGYADGFTIQMDVPQGRYLKDAEIGQSIAQNLKDIGINVQLEVLASAVWAQRFVSADGPRPLSLLTLSQPYLSGIDELRNFIGVGTTGTTRFGWKVPAEFTTPYNQLQSEFDRSKQKDLIDKLNALVWDEALYVFVHRAPRVYGISNKLVWQPRNDEYIRMHEASWAS